MSQNKVTFGLEQVHIAFANPVGPQPAWETPVAVKGAVRFTPTSAGEQSNFYADNMIYYVINSNNGYTAELEMANVPDAIKARMLGWLIDDNGMLIEVADAQPEKFALLGQVQGDKRNRRFVYYDCVANRPNKERSTTTDTTTPATDVLTLTISPVIVDNRKIVKGDIELSDNNSGAFNAFFSAVTKPSTVTPNKTALANTIAVAGSLDELLYTTASWGDLQAALTAATTVNGNANAAQNEIDAANAALQLAISELELE